MVEGFMTLIFLVLIRLQSCRTRVKQSDVMNTNISNVLRKH